MQANLTIMRRTDILSVKRRKKQWEVILSNKHKYELESIIDVTLDQHLQEQILGVEDKVSSSLIAVTELSLPQVRTLVAGGQYEDDLLGILFTDLLQGEHEGFFSLRGLDSIVGGEAQSAPLKASVGQALGGTAAYLAFFKTESENIDVRKLQSELMSYGMRILPYSDVRIDDANFYAIQRIGLAGIFPHEQHAESFILDRARRVRYDEIEPIFNSLYSRSQLWFLDNTGEYFRWKDFMELIQFVGFRGDELTKQIEKDWSGKLKFSGVFDENAYVNRYEFAVILDQYASPYIKMVNQQGKFIH